MVDSTPSKSHGGITSSPNSSEPEFKITPWEVEGEIDYNKVIRKIRNPTNRLPAKNMGRNHRGGPQRHLVVGERLAANEKHQRSYRRGDENRHPPQHEDLRYQATAAHQPQHGRHEPVIERRLERFVSSHPRNRAPRAIRTPLR